MKKNRRLIALTSALVLTGVLAGAAVAAGGDKDDPLVTMSYLDKVVGPEVVSQVEKSTELRQKDLEKKFGDQIGKYQKDMEAAIGNAGSKNASYVLVTLKKGQTMYLDVGCELMLRVGAATVHSNTNPALIDVATAENVNKETALVKNHLYMATIPDRTVSAATDDAKLLVRGAYTIK